MWIRIVAQVSSSCSSGGPPPSPERRVALTGAERLLAPAACPRVVPELLVPRVPRYDLLVMSNRAPALGPVRAPQVGGLVSALEPALRHGHGIWLGWSGQDRDSLPRIAIDASRRPAHARFDLPEALRREFYAGFCNSVLWPLLHGFPQRVRGDDRDWDAYVLANEHYARHAAELVHRDATIWVHDYHLLRVARALRALGHRGRIGLFLHIPFPAPALFETLRWSGDLVDAMLDFDLIGFQTRWFAMNFLSAARAIAGARCDGTTLRRGDRDTAIGVYPATIDPRPFRTRSAPPPEIAGLQLVLGQRRLILGVDRLDYSKGIPERLDAYERMLDRHPRWRRRVTLLQIAVPSRTEIADYAELRQRVEAAVGRINGRFGDIDWVPVRYLCRAYDQRVLALLYRLADVGLITPLCDGMNLVAKEFVAAQDPARPGVLVLSRHAGAAETLADALITDPLDPERLAADIDRALRMSDLERVRRHRALVAALEREGDAKAWARAFLDRLRRTGRAHPRR